MDHRSGNSIDASAALLFQNAVNFGRPASDADGNDVIYRIAISVELLLKACLAAAGIPDTVRTAIGHDLRVATSLAQTLGLDLPVGYGNLLHHIHPHFRDGGFHRPAQRWPHEIIREAQVTTKLLTAQVEAYIQTGGWNLDQFYAHVVDPLPRVTKAIFRRAVAGDALTDIAASMHLTSAQVERQLAAAVRAGQRIDAHRADGCLDSPQDDQYMVDADPGIGADFSQICEFHPAPVATGLA